MIEVDPYDLSDDQSDEVTALVEAEIHARLVRVLVPFTGAEFNYDEADALVIGERLSQGLLEFAQKGGSLDQFTARAKVIDYAGDLLHGLVIEILGPHIDAPTGEPEL